MITEPLVVGFSVADLVSGLYSDGTPSAATFTNVTYTPADPSIATATPDPNVPNGAMINALAAGTTVLNYSATVTETDGFVHTVTGADTVVVTAAPPPPQRTTALVGNFGTPFPTPPPVPTP